MEVIQSFFGGGKATGPSRFGVPAALSSLLQQDVPSGRIKFIDANNQGDNFIVSLTTKGAYRMGQFMHGRSKPLSLLQLPYFEVTIESLPRGRTVALGMSDGVKLQATSLPGWDQNSYGFHGDDGRLYAGYEPSGFDYEGAFGEGDTIGCGVMFDSFHQRKLFFTKNGVVLAPTPFAIHTGMDLYPTIGTDASCVLMVNFGSRPFVWVEAHETIAASLTHLTLSPNGVGYFDELPVELQRIILHASVDAPHDAALRLATVSKRVNKLSEENTIWKPLYLKKYPNQNANLKFKSWKKHFVRRHEAALITKGAKHKPRPVHAIENCTFEFECPMVVEDLGAPGFVDGKTFCDKCSQHVYQVYSESELRQAVDLGRCVALYTKRPAHLRGKVALNRVYR